MNTTKLAILTTIVALVTPVTVAAASLEAQADGEDADLGDIAGLANQRNVLMLDEAADTEITCGKGCGQCEESISCASGYSGSCSCTDTGNTCSWGPWKKAVYTCTCACQPTPPPPEQPDPELCIGTPDPIICVTQPNGATEANLRAKGEYAKGGSEE